MILSFLALACAGCTPFATLPDAVPIETACTVTDGDTVRCGDERIRLLGIDAPELPGHCRQGRSCAPGDPVASTNALSRAMAGKPLTIRRMGKDRYGRTLGVLYADGQNLSCSQLAAGQAIYVGHYDNDQAINHDCAKLTL